jgi:glycosyltransferase involved in cell wall biosynthesis
MNTQIEKPKVSIIIPTHNSAQTLSWCLQSIKNQTYDYCEVIVVDDLSSDETIRIAENFGVKILQQKCNPAEARNLGVAVSTGEYVLFLDSDQSLSPSVIEECVDKCVKEKAEMIRIPEFFVGKGFWSVCSAVWKNHYEKVEHLYGKRISLIHGEPRFFVRTRIEDVGMFDTMLVWGEDYDLYERLKSLNVKEAYCTSVLHHREVVSLRQLLMKNLRYGKSVPVFLHQTNRQVFPSMLSHALLTFTQILKEPQRPTIVAGCALLLWIKSYSIIIGVLRGLRH